MNLRQVYEYYSRPDVRQFFMDFSKGREVVGVYKNGSYSTRPGTLIYPQDIVAMVKEGSLEFHSSIERWSRPMSLKTDNYDSLRTGWDIILDLDCHLFEHGKIAAKVLAWALEKHGLKGYSIKFTGGTGFHIGIPWESIPKAIDYKPSLKMFPELPRHVGFYLREYIRERLERELLKRYQMEQLAEQVERKLGDIMGEKSVLDPFKVVDVDTVLISPRHLFRMPYSLNKNSFLVSLPVKSGDLDALSREDADPQKHDIKIKGFLNAGEPDEAEMLIAEALDWARKSKRKEARKVERKSLIKEAVPEELFPPCLKIILQGLPDGKKRSVFILSTFLRSVKWGWPETEKMVFDWNARNKPPLRDSYVRGQLRWHRMQKREILPPACQNVGWYESFGVCRPDNWCGGPAKTVRNPVNYPLRKMEAEAERPEPERKKPKRRKGPPRF